MKGLVASTENLGGDMPAAILFNGYATVYICIYIYIYRSGDVTSQTQHLTQHAYQNISNSNVWLLL